MDELSFKMPEKWCIRGGADMRSFVDDVIGENQEYFAFPYNCLYTTYDDDFKVWYLVNESEDSTEITFEQFKKFYYSLHPYEQKTDLEQLREKCKRLDFTMLFSGAEFVSLEIVNSSSRTMHRLEKYMDFDKLCENALIILNLER